MGGGGGGGGGAAAAASSESDAPAKEEVKEEEVEMDLGGGMDMFGGDEEGGAKGGECLSHLCVDSNKNKCVLTDRPFFSSTVIHQTINRLTHSKETNSTLFETRLVGIFYFCVIWADCFHPIPFSVPIKLGCN